MDKIKRNLYQKKYRASKKAKLQIKKYNNSIKGKLSKLKYFSKESYDELINIVTRDLTFEQFLKDPKNILIVEEFLKKPEVKLNISIKQKEVSKKWRSIPKNNEKKNSKHREYLKKKGLEVNRRLGKKWRLENPEDNLKSRKKNYDKSKKIPELKIKSILIGRLSSLIAAAKINIEDQSKTKLSRELVGCDIRFLKSYIEEKFKKGMSWENHGMFGWHVDHIKPCNTFDLNDEEQRKECFHYTNLQPLWAKENLTKSKK